MKLISENIEDLRTLYITNLKKALDMEQKITKALPTMIEKSTDQQLATAFSNHLEETRGHVAKVESLLRQARNGKLYDASKNRHRGNSHLADNISQTFDIFTRKYGLNRDIRPLSSAHFRHPEANGQMSLF